MKVYCLSCHLHSPHSVYTSMAAPCCWLDPSWELSPVLRIIFLSSHTPHSAFLELYVVASQLCALAYHKESSYASIFTKLKGTFLYWYIKQTFSGNTLGTVKSLWRVAIEHYLPSKSSPHTPIQSFCPTKCLINLFERRPLYCLLLCRFGRIPNRNSLHSVTGRPHASRQT